MGGGGWIIWGPLVLQHTLARYEVKWKANSHRYVYKQRCELGIMTEAVALLSHYHDHFTLILWWHFTTGISNVRSCSCGKILKY